MADSLQYISLVAISSTRHAESNTDTVANRAIFCRKITRHRLDLATHGTCRLRHHIPEATKRYNSVGPMRELRLHYNHTNNMSDHQTGILCVSGT
jgi:hypothetical protein